MQKLSAQKLRENLTKEGFRFSELTVESVGTYAAADADWNYKDIPHLHHVHEAAEAYPALIGKDVLCNINIQRILGLWFPVTLVIYEVEKNYFVYFTTLFFFVLIVETRAEEKRPLQTTVTTTYHMGYPPLLGFAVPLLKWLLKRNYKLLMEADIPMRERRGELRRLGYDFYKPGETYAFEDTTRLAENNLLLPESMPKAMEVDYRPLMIGSAMAEIGDRGLMGLRLVKEGNKISIWPRTCPHEGAELKSCDAQKAFCPWHGRRFRAIGTFEMGEDAHLTTPEYDVTVTGTVIRWSYVGKSRRAKAAA